MDLLPAIERYDGPAFRVLRRFLRQQRSEVLEAYVLSARFGLIPGSQLIPDYDQRMTPERSRELQPKVVADLEGILKIGHHRELFVSLGRDYLESLNGYATLVPAGFTVRVAAGTIGKKLAALHNWLYGEARRPRPQSWVMNWQGKVRIRGIEVAVTAEGALDLARQALAAGQRDLTRYHSWYVEVDGHRVAPKWLVSQLSGLPVGSFVTDQARRVLAQLGIEVRQE